MKKWVLTSVIMIAMSGWSMIAESTPPEVALSHQILIIESGSVRVKLPDRSDFTEFTSTSRLPSGASIDIENSSPFKVLCRDFDIIENNTSCPQFPEPLLVVDLGNLDEIPPWPLPTPPPGDRDPLRDSKYEQVLERLQGKIDLHKNPVLKGIACHLYVEAKSYKDAKTCCYQALESFPDNKEVQTFTRYQLALIALKQGKRRQSIQHAQKALNTYQQLPESREKFRKSVDHFLKLAENTKNREESLAFAQHHLALLYYYVFEKTEEAIQQAREALNLYQHLGISEMEKDVQKLLNIMTN